MNTTVNTDCPQSSRNIDAGQRALPTQKQLAFLDWEVGVFFHFGIRTFYEGHADWDMMEMPVEGFQPSELDCGQWIRIAKEAGARYAILVCKHHDGFANWPSKYTDYSVANTPWKDGKGDVVQEFVDACRKYGMKVGLYYSPAQFGSDRIRSEEYDDYFVNQISELLENYGQIDYLWFDGCGSENHTYDTRRIIKEIRRMQPDILIFNLWDPDTRWCGNEAGLVSLPNNYVVKNLHFSVLADEQDSLGGERFLPPECDCRIRLQNWFYSDRDADTVKSVRELMGIYDCSVGRGANMLLNLSPDRRGLLPQKDADRLLAFGEQLRARFSSPIAGILETQRTGSSYALCLEKAALVNEVVLEEVIEDGNHIQQFSILIHPYGFGEPILVYRGLTVGHKCICHFPAVYTQRIELHIQEETGTHTLKNVCVYCTDW